MENKNFRRLISLIQQHPKFLTTLSSVQENYLVKIYKITELSPGNVADLYSTMQRKFYLNRKVSNEEAWYENELRIFIWLLFGYLHVFHKTILDLNQEDWKLFSPIFNYKSTVFFQFQSQSLLKHQGKPTLWTEAEVSLLEIIISQKTYKNRWNSVARELFIRSGKQYFRNPKQCRERWMNHLDPCKIHTEWTPSEDLVLLSCIKKKGKRWSIAMKQLSNTRTEHMVKNRYKSLISNQSKKQPGKKQFEIENILIKKLTKVQERQTKEIKQEQIGRIEAEHELRQTQSKQLIKVEDNAKIPERQRPEELDCDKEYKISEEEDLKYESQNGGYNFIEAINQDFKEFAVNSPLFITWLGEDAYHPFDIREDRSVQDEQLAGIIELDSLDDFRI